jgi:hypothetical protein
MLRVLYILLLVLPLLMGCKDSNQGKNSEDEDAWDDGLFYHIFYLDRSGTFIRWDQWDGALKEFIQSSEIPLQSAGQPEGGVQIDPLDTDVLQARDDIGNFILRTRNETPFMGFMDEGSEVQPGSFFYLFLSETGEFREVYRSSPESTIGKFLYTGSAVFFEEIYAHQIVFKRLDIAITPAAERALFTIRTELVSMVLNDAQEPLILIQDQDKIFQYRYASDLDSMVAYGEFSQPRGGHFLPPVSSGHDCIALPMWPKSKYKYHAVYLLCSGNQRRVILPDAPQAVKYAGNQEWLIFGKESIIHIDSRGRFLHQLCMQEPAYLGMYNQDVFVRSMDHTLCLRLPKGKSDTLNPALHDVFFDLLSVRKGPGGYRKS